MSFDLIIKNGVVATAADVGKYDIGVKDGKIAILAPSIDPMKSPDAKVIDAEGAFVTPGGVDSHVHIAEKAFMGAVCADNFETGTLSAICGGTTTILAFAKQQREEKERSLVDVVDEYHGEATGNSYCDYGFHLIITAPDPTRLDDELPKLFESGVSSCKLYMTYDALKLRDGELLDVMLATRKHNFTTMIHAENGEVVEWMTKKLEEKCMTEPYHHYTSRPPIVEAEATNRAISLSEIIQIPILLVHVSAPSAVEHIRNAQTRNVPIHGETCPQYLYLTASNMKGKDFEGAKCVCSPPPRESPLDQEAIWRGLANGTFTVFSSDHAPFRFYDEDGKMRGKKMYPQGPQGHFKHIPNGLPGIETRLPLLMNGVIDGKLTPQKFVELTSTNPAKLYGCYPAKGALLPGLSDADLVIWYPADKGAKAITNGDLHHDVDYTPYEGMKAENWPRYTVLRGEVIYEEGKVKGKKGDGAFLKRGKSSLSSPGFNFLSDLRFD